MPYKMNAQSFARMRNQQSVHKRAKDARWRSHKVVMQGCIKTATQSRYARMHKDSHTEPLHDATAQMAIIAQMQRHKWLSAQGRADPTTANARMRDSACPKFRNDAKPKEQARFDNPATLSPAQQAGYYFWCWGRENTQLAGKAWMPYKMNARRL